MVYMADPIPLLEDHLDQVMLADEVRDFLRDRLHDYTRAAMAMDKYLRKAGRGTWPMHYEEAVFKARRVLSYALTDVLQIHFGYEGDRRPPAAVLCLELDIQRWAACRNRDTRTQNPYESLAWDMVVRNLEDLLARIKDGRMERGWKEWLPQEPEPSSTVRPSSAT